jgi:hypothetical protein
VAGLRRADIGGAEVKYSEVDEIAIALARFANNNTDLSLIADEIRKQLCHVNDTAFAEGSNELTQEQILLEVQKLKRERDLYREALEFYGADDFPYKGKLARNALAEGIRIRDEK